MSETSEQLKVMENWYLSIERHKTTILNDFIKRDQSFKPIFISAVRYVKIDEDDVGRYSFQFPDKLTGKDLDVINKLKWNTLVTLCYTRDGIVHEINDYELGKEQCI